MNQLTKYEELLITALRSCFDEGQAADLRQLSITDWHALIDNALIQSVTPFIWHNLKSFKNPIDIPNEIKSRFIKASIEASGRGVIIQNQLSGLLRLLNERHIPVIVLKGCHLADKLYRDFSIRPMQDIDILIKDKDAKAAENALVSADYTPINSVYNPVFKDTHFTYKPLNVGVPLEVHISLKTHRLDRELDIEQIWGRAEAISITGHDAFVLVPEDLIIYQCFHISYHLFLNLGLRSLCDVAMIIRHYDGKIDWLKVIERAREWQVFNIVFLPLEMTRKLLNVQASDEFYRGLKNESVNPDLEEWVKAQLFGGLEMKKMKSANLAEFWNSGSFTEKVSILFKAIFLLDERIREKYHHEYKGRWKFPLYLFRLRDLIKRHSGSFWRLLIRDKNTLEISEHEARRSKAQSALKSWLKRH